MTLRALILVPAHQSSTNKFLLRPLNGRTPLDRTIDYGKFILESGQISGVISIATDDPAVVEHVRQDSSLLIPLRTEKELNPALAEALVKAETETGEKFDIAIVLEPPQPFRPRELFLAAFDVFTGGDDVDSVVCVSQLRGRIWAGDGAREPIADTFDRGQSVSHVPYQELVGLLTIVRRDNILAMERVGERIGLVVVERKWAFVDVSSEESFEIAERLEPIYRKLDA